MWRVTRSPILIILLAVVLLAPLFEFFDQSGDMEQGNDFVLALLCIFVATSLFLLCRRVIAFLFRLFLIAVSAPASVVPMANRSIETTASPPGSLLLLSSLRI